jgi:hypothetical protein
MRFIEVLDPTSAPRTTELALASRSGSLAGKTLGFLSNGKANAELLLESIERQLRVRFSDFAVVKGSKRASTPAPDSVMERLRRCNVVVTAIAD